MRTRTEDGDSKIVAEDADEDYAVTGAGDRSEERRVGKECPV